MSIAIGPDICLIAGDTYETTLTVRDGDDPIDISNWIITMTVDGFNPVTATITNGASGEAVLSLSSAVTGSMAPGVYGYQVRFADADSAPTKTYRGRMKIEKSL